MATTKKTLKTAKKPTAYQAAFKIGSVKEVKAAPIEQTLFHGKRKIHGTGKIDKENSSEAARIVAAAKARHLSGKSPIDLSASKRDKKPVATVKRAASNVVDLASQRKKAKAEEVAYLLKEKGRAA